MERVCISLNIEVKDKLDDFYYPLKRKKKIKSYGDLILMLLKNFKEKE